VISIIPSTYIVISTPSTYSVISIIPSTYIVISTPSTYSVISIIPSTYIVISIIPSIYIMRLVWKLQQSKSSLQFSLSSIYMQLTLRRCNHIHPRNFSVNTRLVISASTFRRLTNGVIRPPYHAVTCQNASKCTRQKWNVETRHNSRIYKTSVRIRGSCHSTTDCYIWLSVHTFCAGCDWIFLTKFLFKFSCWNLYSLYLCR